MEQQHLNKIYNDPWQSLRAFTSARIALGRTGNAMPLEAVLQIKLAHAHARDAVYSELNLQILNDLLALKKRGVLVLESSINTRTQYLKRPDLGRILSESSIKKIEQLTFVDPGICIVVADGLSAKAINKHALPVLDLLIPLLENHHYKILPLCLATQARVALGDHIGSLVQAEIIIMLIGERPGLTSPESMSVYITYKPMLGTTDESRNCISNIRPEGLPYNIAADKIFYLVQQSLRLKLSGTMLKDEQQEVSRVNNGE
ncbi:MAG: ethanolamine ammonia-lyase subunit EutC [Bacteroidota bacterium]